MKKTLLLALLMAGVLIQDAQASFRYVREKANPLNYTKAGDVAPGGLGDFDQTLYEEVEGTLPDGAVRIKPKGLADELREIFNALPVDIRAYYGPAYSAVQDAILRGDNEAAKLIVENADVPPELESLKNQMIAVFISNGG